MDRKIKILIVTYLPWRDDNNIGNSYSNIFRGCGDKYEFAHVYARDGLPQNSLCKEYYHISEKKLIKNIFNKKVVVGEYKHIDDASNTPKDTFSKAYNLARILRWQVFLLVRELFEFNTAWKSNKFDEFLDNFNPDIVFGTMPDEALTNRVMRYVKDYKGIPVVTYPWDDYYSLDHNSWSPFFWIRKFLSRHFLRSSAAASEYLYVITNLMKDEYEKIFKKECRLLFKGHEFDVNRIVKPILHNPINFVYMGNIGQGRWKTLADLAKSIKAVNDKLGKTIFHMDVYTLSPKSDEIIKSLNIEGVSRLNDAVPNDQVPKVMNNADALLHVEPFKKSEYQFYRASFSTKLVDYFYAAKCILAVGGMTASTDYLVRNDAAICITDRSSITDRLMEISKNPEILIEYAHKSWTCGCRNHQIQTIQDNMYNDFKKLLQK